MFKIGDIVVCINTNGWGNLFIRNKPFKVDSFNLFMVNGTYTLDFKLHKKEVKELGIVKFMEETSK